MSVMLNLNVDFGCEFFFVQLIIQIADIVSKMISNLTQTLGMDLINREENLKRFIN